MQRMLDDGDFGDQATVERLERRAEITRQRFAEAQAGRPEPRPFASVSRGAGRSTEHTGPDCWVCAEARRRDAARAREDAVAVYGEIAR